jgi:hypothetical protein
MFVQHSVHINKAFDLCSAALARDPKRWFPAHGDQASYSVGPMIAGVPFQKRVYVEAGEPVKVGDSIEVPVKWRATFIKGLFPLMEGKVELVSVDPDVTRLSVCGMYEPTLAKFRKHVDDALMHRVAEGTVKELAESIAKRLAAEPSRFQGPRPTRAIRP